MSQIFGGGVGGGEVINLQAQPMQAGFLGYLGLRWLLSTVAVSCPFCGVNVDKMLLVCFPCAHSEIIYNDETGRSSYPRNTALQSARV